LPHASLFSSVELDEESSFNPIDESKKEEEFRNYKDGARQKKVAEFYRLNHTRQNFDFVMNLKRRIKFDQMNMTIWEAFQKLEEIIDDSDPDTNLTQLQHGLQTAEAIRREYPDEEWLQIAGLIHDLGKVLCFPCFGLEQWAIVGDTFPVGCKFSDKNIFPEYFVDNTDYHHPVYSTELGIYKRNCGLMNLHLSYGHDEYLYQVLLHNKTNLPIQAMYIIRFHSFYAWHKQGAYTCFTDAFDEEMFPWIKRFNRFDLYSKAQVPPDYNAVKDYYKGLVEKFLPGVLEWWFSSQI